MLVEVNCETDFVARGDIFQELVRNVAMQVAACPNVDYVKVEDIPAEVAEREKQIEMGRDDLAGKKEEMKEKIVAGRIGKRLKEMSLLDQPYIKDSGMTVDQLVKEVSGKIENIQVRRFVHFNLGEGIEIEKMDFAAEVAAMQADREVPSQRTVGGLQRSILERPRLNSSRCSSSKRSSHRPLPRFGPVPSGPARWPVAQRATGLFHLATQVVPERYNQLSPERRETFQRRLQSLVSAPAPCDGEQVMGLAAQQARKQGSGSCRNNKRSSKRCWRAVRLRRSQPLSMPAPIPNRST